jgi:hypothetical protein
MEYIMDERDSVQSARVFLIHATPVSIAPINASFKRLWPEAALANLLDDSLAVDLQAAGGLNKSLTGRFLTLAGYAQDAGADGVLFTCSAFGPAIEACRQKLSIPVLKPNEAMIEEAIGQGDKLALIATFEPSLGSMVSEIQALSCKLGRKVTVKPFHVPGALAALQAGDQARHHELIAGVAAQVADCDLICFAQFSMADAAQLSARASGRQVLTTPDSAVRRLRTLLAGTGS